MRGLREAEPLFDETAGLEVLRDTVEQLDALVEKFALIAETAAHPHVALGAVKGQLSAIEKRLSLQQQLGLLPADIGLYRQSLELQEVIDVVGDVLRRYDKTGAIADELLRRLDCRSTPRQDSQWDLPAEYAWLEDELP